MLELFCAINVASGLRSIHYSSVGCSVKITARAEACTVTIDTPVERWLYYTTIYYKRVNAWQHLNSSMTFVLLRGRWYVNWDL
ncbi:hypothetical protein ACUY4R_000182 [Kosakonia sp. BK9b]